MESRKINLRPKSHQEQTKTKQGKPAQKRKRSVDIKRKFESVFKIEPTNILNDIPTNGQVLNFLYGSFTHLSLENRCYSVAGVIKKGFDEQNLNYGVGVDRISQKLKNLLSQLKQIKGRLNVKMNEEKKENEERAFVKLMKEIFSVGLIPTGLAARQVHLIGKCDLLCITRFCNP